MARTVLTVTVLVVLLAGQALAQIEGLNDTFDRAKRWEISLQTRYVAEKNISKDDGSAIDFEDDLGWGFGLGFNLTESFNLGFNVNWRNLPYSSTLVSVSDPDTIRTISGRMDSTDFVFAATWTPLKGRFSPYLNGGVGWMNIDSNIVTGVESGCWWDPWWGYICDNYERTYSVNAAVYDLGIGARFALNTDLFLRIGYEHGWTGDNTYDGSDVFRLDIGGLM